MGVGVVETCASPHSTNVEDQQYRESEGVLWVWSVCVCVGGGRRRRVISAFRFYYLQIYISNVMIIYLHLEVFVLHL